MGSNWDKQWVNDDGTVNGTYYVTEVDYQAVYDLYNAEPVGDKHDLDTVVRQTRQGNVITIDGKAVAQLPTDWNRITSRIDPVHGLACLSNLQWRAYDKPPRFMLKVYIKNV